MRYLFSLILLVIGSLGFSQQITFQKLYGKTCCPGDAMWGQITMDGGYIMMLAQSGLDTAWHPSLIKTDMYGDTLWTMYYDFKADYLFSQGQQTADGGYILTGRTSILGSKYEAWLMKTNSTGHVQWLKSYGGSRDDYGYSVEQTNDQGFIMVGGTQSFGQGNPYIDVYLVKTNSQGDTLWTRTYGNSKNDEGWAVRQTSDNGFIVAGTYSGGLNKLYLIKTDSFGDTLWTKTLGDSTYNLMASDIRQTSDGGYIIIGSIGGIGAGMNDICLIKIASNGSVMWSKTYGNAVNDEGYSVRQISGSGYILAGRFGKNFRDAFMIKTDAQGDTLWTRLYGASSTFTSNDDAYFADETPDKGFILAGSTMQQGINSPGESAFLVKTDSLGRSGCGEFNAQVFVASFSLANSINKTYISSGGKVSNLTSTYTRGFKTATACEFIGVNEITNYITLDVSPNPFTSSTLLTLSDRLVINSKTVLTIYNELGQELRSQNIITKTTRIERGGFEKGVYFFKVRSDRDIIAIGKFIIQ